MDLNIVDVWADNLYSAFKEIRELVKTYKFLAMDTEFPGVVAKPIGNFTSHSTFVYQQLRCNVDLLKIIQLGITFSDHEGNSPKRSTYQFNFQFDMDVDMCAQESINLLQEAQLNFEKHKIHGIQVAEFGNLLITSGLILTDEVTWLSFHSSYDFAYLYKIVMNDELPQTETKFFDYLTVLFPNFFDVKYLLRGSKLVKRGLQEIAEEFSIKRIGVQHQAGSDSILTRDVFFKVKDQFYQKDELLEHSVKLFGIECKQQEQKTLDFEGNVNLKNI